jgi:hypothetical protein
MTASAQANPSQRIVYVAVYNGANLLHTAVAAPYTSAWTAPPGTYSLTAAAYDNWGAVATSRPVVVTVNAER